MRFTGQCASKKYGAGSWQIWKDLQAGESITNVKLRMTNGAVESITNDEWGGSGMRS